MKKILTILFISIGSLILLLFIGVWIVGAFFKDDIKLAIDEVLAETIQADVNYELEHMSIGVLRSFPNLEFTIHDVGVINRAPFAGDTLMHIKEFAIEVKLVELLSSHIVVNGVRIESPTIKITTNKEGASSYDIFKKSKEEPNEKRNEESQNIPNITLSYWHISDAHISYLDSTNNAYVHLKQLNQHGSASLHDQQLNIDVSSSISSIDAMYNAVKYLNNHRFQSSVQASYDMDKGVCKIAKGSVKLNEFVLTSSGELKVLEGGNGYQFNLNVGTTSDFKELLSMIPAIYKTDFEAIRASGGITFQSHISGVYSDSSLPAFDASLKVNNGKIQYEDLPLPVEDVQLDASIENKDGVIDHTNISVKQLHLTINNHPIHIEALLKNLNTYELKAKGKVDFDALNKAYPLEAKTFNGKASFDIFSTGNIDDLQQEVYQHIQTRGEVSLTDINVAMDSFPTTTIHRAQFRFNPSSVTMEVANMLVGKSDLALKGELKNYMGYLFRKGKVLKGTLSLQSNLINVDEWLSSEKAPETSQTKKESSSKDTAGKELPTPLPTNIDFSIKAHIKSLALLDMSMSNVKGDIVLKDGNLTIKHTSLQMLGGVFQAKGTYKTKARKLPLVRMSLQAKKISAKQAYKTFNTIKKWAPIAKHLSGSVNATIDFSSQIGESYYPVYSSINGKGNVYIPKAGIEKFELLNKLASLTNIKELHNPSFYKTSVDFHIENGKLYTDPFNFSVEGINSSVSGNTSLDGNVDYQMQANIPGEKAQQYIEQALGGSDLAKYAGMIDEIPLSIYFKGPYDKVKISVVPNNQKITTAVNQQLKSKVNKKKQEAQDVVRQRAQEALGSLLDKDDKRSEEEKINSVIEKGRNQLLDLFNKKKKK